MWVLEVSTSGKVICDLCTYRWMKKCLSQWWFVLSLIITISVYIFASFCVLFVDLWDQVITLIYLSLVSLWLWKRVNSNKFSNHETSCFSIVFVLWLLTWCCVDTGNTIWLNHNQSSSTYNIFSISRLISGSYNLKMPKNSSVNSLKQNCLMIEHTIYLKDIGLSWKTMKNTLMTE